MSQEKYVKLEHLDRVARLTLDRPEALNAVNSQVMAELMAVVSEVAADPEVRALILTGAGDRSFIAGADIREMSAKSPQQAREFARAGHRLTRLLEEMDKPVIAAVNGVALGGGCEIAIACDVRLAGERAKLGQPEVGLGIITGWGATVRLPRLVGEGIAREMLFSGRVLTAEEALKVGLVNSVLPQEQLAEEALKLANTMASKAPLAVAYAKRCLNLARSLDAESASELEMDLFALCFSTEDQKEGMGAFVEKRTPSFQRR